MGEAGHRERRLRWGAGWGLAYAVLWVISAVLTGAGIGFAINRTPELLHNVAQNQQLFVAANVLGVAAQFAVPGFLVGLSDLVERRSPAVVSGLALWALSAPVFIVSCAFHAVFGTVPGGIARRTPHSVTSAVILQADALHHLGDFCYFVGILLISAALVLLLRALRWSGRFGRATVVAGIVAVAATVLQFGWLAGALPLEDLGILGIVAQVAVVVMLSVHMQTAAVEPAAPVDPAPAGGS